MIPPIDCPYKGLSAPPCWTCSHYIADTDQCDMNNIARATDARSHATSCNAQTFEDRLRDYEKRRQELLQLSKETLVDLIIHRPTY